MTIWIDIETIPGTIPPELATIAAPANYKNPDAIARYQTDNCEKVYREQSLISLQGRICCVAWAIDDEDPRCIGIWNKGGEKGILDELARAIESISPIWGGFNIRSFDLNWLWHRAVRYGVSALIHSIPRERYSRLIIDVREMWTGGDQYAKGKMSEIAAFLGISTLPGDGSQVWDWYKAGDYASISEHCIDDVIIAREIYRRMNTYNS
jgi:predicted PolB exonuclease-like 3'-5' exonuclease